VTKPPRNCSVNDIKLFRTDILQTHSHEQMILGVDVILDIVIGTRSRCTRGVHDLPYNQEKLNWEKRLFNPGIGSFRLVPCNVR
jgi:hypothetical protein